MKKTLFIFFVFILASGAYLYHKHTTKQIKIEYDTVFVEKGKIRVDIMASGTIQPVNIVSVGTQVSGIIEKVFVDYNSVVEKGQLIAQLETFILEEDLKESRAKVMDAKAQLDYAKINAKRYKELFKENYIARYELEEADLKVVNAKATYDTALAGESKALKNLGYADVVSPVDGVIVSKEVEEGQTVASSLQTPELFTIAEDLTKMQIEAEISEADIGQIKQGLPVTFTVDTFPADIFDGVVSQIRLQPQEESNVVMYTVVIDISNDDLRLLPGMTAYVTITVEEKEEILKLRSMAFQFRPTAPKSGGGKGGQGGGSGHVSNTERQKMVQARQELKPNEAMIFVLENNEPKRRKVTKGISDSISTEIVEGLFEGEEVILEDLTTKPSTKGQRGPGGF